MKTFKKIVYWCSLVCPVFDLLKCGLAGAAKGLQASIEDYDRKLDEKIKDALEAEFRRQKRQMYEDSFTEDEKNV